MTVTRSEIRHLIAQLSATSDPFDDGEDLFSRGILRSMNLLELVNQLEDRFQVRIGHHDFLAGRLRSVDSILALVGARP